MTTSRAFTMALGAAAAAFLLAAGALAQHYVPLRYDLRYTTNPGYIQAVPYASAPSRPDSYAFGSIRYGDLDLTGNVRAGKSFRGNVPFTQQGSQVATGLPSLALSNFRRDSVGIEDIGTGVEYGAALPYFPGSGSVTSITTAQTRFATPLPQNRAPYGLPNINSALPGYTALPGATVAGSTPPPAVSPQQAAAYKPGLYIPRSAIEWVNALVEGRGGAPPMSRIPPAPGESTPPEPTPEQRRMDLRLGLPSPQADPRLGLPQEATERGPHAAPPEETPSPLPSPETDAAASAPADVATSPLYWRLREAARTDRTLTPAGAPTTADAPPGRSRRTDAREPGEPQSALPGDPDLPPEMPPAPERLPTAPASFEDYLRRAEAAMKAGQHGAADALFEAAIVMDPSQPAAFFGRLAALLGDYRYLQAAMVLDRGLKAHPKWARQVPDLKTAYQKPSTYDRILADLAEDVRNRSQSAEPNLLLGYVYAASSRPDDARPYLKHVAAIRGERAGAEKPLLEAVAPPAPGK